MYNEPIGPAQARDWLVLGKPLAPRFVGRFEALRAEILAKYDITPAQFNGPQRSQRLVRARHELWFRASRELEMSLPQIGRRCNRDHTTILHGIEAEVYRRTGVEPKRLIANRMASRKRYEAKKAARAAALCAE